MPSQLTDYVGICRIRAVEELKGSKPFKLLIVFDRIDPYGKAFRKPAHWVSQGKIQYHETAADGLESAPKAFIEILNGQSLGKQRVKHV